jgi:hypothetical protein
MDKPLHYFVQLCAVILFGFSSCAFALELNSEPAPVVHQDVSELQQQIAQLPEPGFLEANHVTETHNLLGTTIDLQQSYRDHFSNALQGYRDDTIEWRELENTAYSLRMIGKSKEQLLARANANVQNQVTGFGPSGVLQFKLELDIAQLNAQFIIYSQLRSFKKLISDLLISPIPVIWVGVKVLFVMSILMWWLSNSKRLIGLFRTHFIESSVNPSLWVRLVWYTSRASNALAWLLAITLTLRLLSSIPSLKQLEVLEIFTWWILGGSIAISFILEFVYRNSRRRSPTIATLRLSTVRWYVWSFIFVGVTLQIAERILGKTAIYYWILSLVWFWFALVTIMMLRKWRSTTFEILAEMKDKPVWVVWSEKRQRTPLISWIATTLGILWIGFTNIQHSLVALLSRFTFFSQALAYLFKIEVAKQQTNEQKQGTLKRIRGEEVFKYVLPGSEESELIDYALPELKQVSNYVLSDSPAVVVISGERGVGVTTFLKQLLHKVKNATPVYINTPYAGYSEVISALSKELGLADEASEADILKHLRSSEQTYLFAVDNAQRLVKPMVGGLNDLLKLTNLLRQSKKNHRCMLAVEKSSWRFVDRARGERLLFDWVAFLPKWNEAQMADLLRSRVSSDPDYPLSFEGLSVPKQWDHEEMDDEKRAQTGFYRILWHYADGNPTVALRFFRFSLRREKTTNHVVVRLFQAPVADELEKMPKPMLAVLRSIVQLEVASQEELSQCTQLSVAEVLGTLRYFQSRGYIEWSDDKARVSDHWFRQITNVLHRQHLLVK